jgi:undecaprenyl-diphosphatase
VKRLLQPEIAWCRLVILGLGAFLVVSCIVTKLLWKVLGPAATALIDAPILSWLATHRLGRLTDAMREVSGLGSEGFLLAVIVIAGSVLRRQTRSWRPLLILVAMASGAIAIEKVVEVVVARPRPPSTWMVDFQSGWSFPSGHAMRSAAVYGGAACLTVRLRAFSRRTQLACWGIAAALSFLVGASRVYLGVHWPTDVAGGWILGTGWLWLVFLIQP